MGHGGLLRDEGVERILAMASISLGDGGEPGIMCTALDLCQQY